MIELQTYLYYKNISLRRLQQLIQIGTVKKISEQGKDFIIDKDMVSDKAIQEKVKEQLKVEFGLLIKEAHNDKSKRSNVIEYIIGATELWNKRGVEIKGFSEKQIYKKIRNPKKLDRGTRSDKFKRKNEMLANEYTYDLMIAYAWEFYDTDTNKSIRLATQRVQMLAKEIEELYELAAVPFTTLYDNIKKAIDNLCLAKNHDLRNKYNSFRQNRIYVKGAFTGKHINFMDWYVIDDKVMDVAGTYVWDPIKGKMIAKKVYMWSIIECKTWHVVAYKILPYSFNETDIKMLLLEAFMNMGAPKKGILMDNGIASSLKVREMLAQLGIISESGGAYEPLHKATIERFNKFLKDEFASNFPNYIGGSRKEVRHSDKKLSPEECDHMINEFSDKLDIYIQGFYQTKPRDLTIDDVVVKTTIREHFDKCYMNYNIVHISDEQLSNAYMEGTIKKMDWNYINIFGELYMFNDVTNPMLNGKKYLVKFNPLNKNNIYIYATEDILNQGTGDLIEKGDYVGTLVCQRSLGNEEAQRATNEIIKAYPKAIKKASEVVTDMIAIRNVDAFSPEINKKGQATPTRKEQVNYVKAFLDDEATKIIRAKDQELRKPRKIEKFEGEFNPDELEEPLMTDEEREDLNRLANEF